MEILIKYKYLKITLKWSTCTVLYTTNIVTAGASEYFKDIKNKNT